MKKMALKSCMQATTSRIKSGENDDGDFSDSIDNACQS